MIKKNIFLASFVIYWLSMSCVVLAQDTVSTEPANDTLLTNKDSLASSDQIKIDQESAVPSNEHPTEQNKNLENDTLSKRELALIDEALESDIEVNFSNASLQNIVDQISQLFNLTFIPDDIIKIPSATTKALSETKVSFTTNRPLTKQRTWNLFTTFLELAGWSLASTPDPHIYRITATEKANHSPLPTYINTSLDIIPKSDQRIRYVCFLENSTPDLMEPLLKRLQSTTAQIDKFALLRAIIITDTAYNIYSLLQIVRELDKTSSSQVLSVIHLKEADASDVVSLIESLQGKDSKEVAVPWMPPKQESTLFYFSKEVKVIAAPRTNSLIIIGPKEGTKRIEQFILTHVDTELTQRYRPVHVFNLNYAPAEQIANILNKVVGFTGKKSDSKTPTVGETGGVLGGLKHFDHVFIEPEKQNNRLIIRCSEEDYAHLEKIIRELDQRQLQVAIEVMIVEIGSTRTRQWGIQWDTKKNRTLNAQMSGFWGSKIQTTETATPSAHSNSIIANLIGLAKLPEAGTTVLTLGKESIHAIAGILEQDDQSRIIANPFIVTTNKYRASVAIAERRRIEMQTVATSGTKGQQTFNAVWEVSVTPQINDEGIINLNIDIKLEDFDKPLATTADPTNANKTSTHIQTNTNVSNEEVIALGGLIKKKKTVEETRFPVLSRIPIIGNLFKNTTHENEQRTLVVLMTPTIIYPTGETVNTFTQNKAEKTSRIAEWSTERHERNRRDPMFNWFFKATDDDVPNDIRNFVDRAKIKKTEPAPLKSETANAIIQATIKQEENGSND